MHRSVTGRTGPPAGPRGPASRGPVSRDEGPGGGYPEPYPDGYPQEYRGGHAAAYQAPWRERPDGYRPDDRRERPRGYRPDGREEFQQGYHQDRRWAQPDYQEDGRGHRQEHGSSRSGTYSRDDPQDDAGHQDRSDYTDHDYDGFFRPQPGRGGPTSPRRRRRLLRRRWFQASLALVLAFLVVVSWSVGNALTVPGGGTFSDRMAEWARDHYLGPVVTLGEWLTYKPPKVGGKPSFALTPRHAQNALPKPSQSVVTDPPPATLASLAGSPLPGEGQWKVVASVNGVPAIYATFLRASATYSSYAAGIASIDQNLVDFQLRPGSEDPGPGNWNAADYIPPGTRTGLLATFNSGFKIAQSGGGFYLNGATAGTLTDGIASVVYYRDGHIAVGVWGQTVGMTPDVVGVRQNLHLVVANGQIPSSVDSDVESSWGATLGGSYYVWRSGIGVTADGRVIFVYGPALDVRELAELLQRAGAVNAMQLDINPEWMSFMYYQPGQDPANPTPTALLPDQSQPADRYYSVSGRDFTAVYAK